jgi:hypothetical protein
VVGRRRGRTKIGCLIGALAAVTIAYFSVNVAEVYWRYYRFSDAMKTEARFASRRTDDEIKRKLAALADSLGLPEGAGKIRVRRTQRHISISSEYYERVELPLVVREILFTPQAEWTF